MQDIENQSIKPHIAQSFEPHIVMLKKIIISVYIIIIVVLATATIVEKYHGSPYVATYIYGAWWMCVLWSILAALSIFYILSRHVRRLSMITLHLSFIVILIGAFLTHTTSVNGMIHLRQGETTNVCQVQDDEDGLKYQDLPFSIRLDKFEVKKHEGTNAAEDYVTRFTILNGTKDSIKGEVSMNHIFSHHNSRLYQASYDEDERGSYLSLNSDPYGIGVTYTGYALLFIGLIWILFDPKGKYRHLLRELRTEQH